MLSCRVWEDGSSWEDRCRCIQSQKEELAKKVNTLEEALRQTKTRCEYWEYLVRQLERRQHPPTMESMTTVVPNSFPAQKYDREEQDFIRDLQRRNTSLQQHSSRVQHRLKSAVQVIKKYKKDIDTLRLRKSSGIIHRNPMKEWSAAHVQNRKGACRKTMDTYIHQIENFPEYHDDYNNEEDAKEGVFSSTPSFVPESNPMTSSNFTHRNKIDSSEDKHWKDQLHQIKSAYQLLQTQYSALESKTIAQSQLQKQLIFKLDESNEYIQKLQEDIQVLHREKSTSSKFLDLDVESYKEQINKLLQQNKSLKDRIFQLPLDDNTCCERKDDASHNTEIDFQKMDRMMQQIQDKENTDRSLQQEIDVLKEQLHHGTLQITQLQEQLHQSTKDMDRLKINLDRTSMQLCMSQDDFTKYQALQVEFDEQEREITRLQEELASQLLLCSKLHIDMKTKDGHTQGTIMDLKTRIEVLERVRIEQENQIISLSHKLNEEEEKRQIAATSMLHDENSFSLDILNRFFADCNDSKSTRTSLVTVQIFDADFTPCSLFDPSDDFQTFVVVDFMDFESQASGVVSGLCPTYNFKSLFNIHPETCLYTSRIYIGRKKNLLMSSTHRSEQVLATIEIYHLCKSKKTTIIGRADIVILEQSDVYRCSKPCQFKVVSLDDDELVYGSIRLSVCVEGSEPRLK